MKTPLATYRLQFRNGMTFDKAVEAVPYLKRLGISHLYASPIFTATSGSTHGYDIVDYNEIDPTIGGRDGFERLNAALREHGLDLILDIVPNHMAASLENRWWRSVVEWGEQSPFSRHFDIDWSERLTLPLLGRQVEDCIAANELSLALDTQNGCLALAYYENLFPLHPASYEEILARFDTGQARTLSQYASLAAPGAESKLRDAIRRLSDDTASIRLVRDFAEASREAGFIRFVHDEQPWRLTFWKDASEHLSYRRFFEVTGLVGTRVEDGPVFDDAHRLILELVLTGMVDGLRVDHVDGLADPAAYLSNLRRAVGPDIFLTVEKILESGETLPPEWPISGTTGYEFIASLANVMIDREGLAILGEGYGKCLGEAPELWREERAAKSLMLSQNFAGEVSRLVRLCAQAIAASPEMPPLKDDEIRQALTEIIIAFPVYRTYGTAGGTNVSDTDLLERVCANAMRHGDATAIGTVGLVARGAVSSDATKPADEFRVRFQQLTGPIMAKAVEDTLFYRFNELIALNEVGGDPAPRASGADSFHSTMTQRRERQPFGLSASATHDTKRGEDARARLYALSEMPDVWVAAVDRWRALNSDMVVGLENGPAPEPNTEWLIYQALAGVWPEEQGLNDEEALTRIRDRFLPYLEKALREAKLRTSWTEIDAEYENAVKTYASRLLSAENREFLSDFQAVVKPLIAAGRINSLSQTLLKLTAPGVPDIYQGSEHRDLSLVDPDNRRPIDFKMLERGFGTLPDIHDPLCFYALKQRLIANCLAARRARPRLFTTGAYEALTVTGARKDHVIAFVRSDGDHMAATIAPRLSTQLFGDGEYNPRIWDDTAVEMPDSGRDFGLTDLISKEQVRCGKQLRLTEFLCHLPASFLTSFSFEQEKYLDLPQWKHPRSDAD